MYWGQKAQLLCDTQAHADQLENQILNFLSTKSPRYLDVEQSSTSTARPSVIVVIEYDNQADADQVWARIQNAHTNFLVAPSFAAYAQWNDDGSLNTQLGRIDV